jgi:hypothetical protein
MMKPRYFELNRDEYPLLYMATGKTDFIDLFANGLQELTEQEFLDKLADMNGRKVGRTCITGLEYTIYGPSLLKGVN